MARSCPFNSMAPVPAIADMVADHRRRSTIIVTPLERLTHPSQPGRTWSDSREEHQHGTRTLVRTQPEAAKRIGPAAAVRGSGVGGDASPRRGDRRGQQCALRRGPSRSIRPSTTSRSESENWVRQVSYCPLKRCLAAKGSRLAQRAVESGRHDHEKRCAAPVAEVPR
jgi:hypothetical protein